MAGAYVSTSAEASKGGYRNGSATGIVSRRRQEREQKMADREQEKKAAESIRDLFDASCIDASSLMRKVYMVTDAVGITRPTIRIKRYVATLDDAIVDTYEEIKKAEDALSEADVKFNAEREERTKIKHAYTQAETILTELEDAKQTLQNEKKELAEEQFKLKESEENADKWAEADGKLEAKNKELHGLEKDIEDHKEDMSELRTEMIYTQNRYIIEKKNRITYKNDLTKLRKTRDNLEYIRATLEPYILQPGNGVRVISVGTQRAKELTEQGKKLIFAFDNREKATEKKEKETSEDELNLEDLQHTMPEEINRNEESKMKDRFNKILEEMEEEDHEI